jgi:acetyltransferase
MSLYPPRWERIAWTLDGVPYRIRPIRPADIQHEQDFFLRLSPESRYSRLMGVAKGPSPALLARYTHIDYLHEMAFVAVAPVDTEASLIALASYVTNSDRSDGEFAVAVTDDWQQRGVGAMLMRHLFAYARAHHVAQLRGEIFSSNARMLEMVQYLGMTMNHIPGNATLMEAVVRP